LTAPNITNRHLKSFRTLDEMSEAPVEMTQAVVLRLSEHFVAGGATAMSAGLGHAIDEVALAL
jgi:hypothetical protein